MQGEKYADLASLHSHEFVAMLTYLKLCDNVEKGEACSGKVGSIFTH